MALHLNNSIGNGIGNSDDSTSSYNDNSNLSATCRLVEVR